MEYLGTNKLVNYIKPVVSISVQTYQHASFIGECLDGILMQKTDFPFEIILGEDESIDGTREICIKYAEKYPDKIRLFLRSRKDVIYFKGNPTGRFNFIENLKDSRGKYIALCDGDDYWTDPLKLQKQVRFLEKNENYSICFHQSKRLYTNGKEVLFNNYSEDKTFILKDIIKHNNISTASCIFRNYNINFPNWFLNLPVADWALHILNTRFGEIYYLNECMSVYRIHSKGLWMGFDDVERLKRGIEVLQTINIGLKFKYKVFFDEAIRIRRSNLHYHENVLSNGTIKSQYWKAKHWIKMKLKFILQ